MFKNNVNNVTFKFKLIKLETYIIKKSIMVGFIFITFFSLSILHRINVYKTAEFNNTLFISLSLSIVSQFTA